jgi:hypothetical protein
MERIEKLERVFFNPGGKPKTNKDGTRGKTAPSCTLVGPDANGEEVKFTVPRAAGKKLYDEGVVVEGKTRDGAVYPKIVKAVAVEGGWFDGLHIFDVDKAAPERAGPSAHPTQGAVTREIVVATYRESLYDAGNLLNEYTEGDPPSIETETAVAATLFIQRFMSGCWADATRPAREEAPIGDYPEDFDGEPEDDLPF